MYFAKKHKVDPASVLPPDHQLGMRVTKGGSCCENCEYLKDETHCGNPGFIKWNGSARLPQPDNQYCCDLWQPRKGKENE